MENGTWTFRCRECGSAFEIPLTERDRAGDFASDKRCPSCGSAPNEVSQADALRGDCRHKIIGYRADRKPRSFVL